MTDEQPRTATGAALTNLQRDRIDFARRDHESTRAEDLAQLDEAGLILVIERLRRRLDDTLQILHEVTQGADGAGRS